MNPYLVLFGLFLLTQKKSPAPGTPEGAPPAPADVEEPPNESLRPGRPGRHVPNQRLDKPITSPPNVNVPEGGLEVAPPPADGGAAQAAADRAAAAQQAARQAAQQAAAEANARAAQQQPPPGPAPVTSTVIPGCDPLAPRGPLQNAAKNMVEALAIRMADGTGRGAYRVEDMGIYKDFQRAARLNSDGYPGKNGTMKCLSGALSSINLQLPAGLPLYPWARGGSYDGVNAPRMADWDPSKVAAPARPAPARPVRVPPGTPAQAPAPGPQASYSPETGFTVPPYVPAASAAVTSPVLVAAQNMITRMIKRLNDGTGYGAYRKADMPIYKAFQGLAGLAVDGEPGKTTMDKLAVVLKPLFITIPPSIPIKPAGWFSKYAEKDPGWNATTPLDLGDIS